MKKTFYALLYLMLGLITFTAGTSFAASAKAVLAGTAPGSTISGIITFQDSPEGLIIKGEINGALAGKHGFHIHDFGDISDAGNAAGGHYNPDNHQHGFLPKDGLASCHAGDFGNIEIDETGHGIVELTIPGLTVTGGTYSVAGRSVIFHEKEDDFGQPTGNAGGRIGAGTIFITEK